VSGYRGKLTARDVSEERPRAGRIAVRLFFVGGFAVALVALTFGVLFMAGGSPSALWDSGPTAIAVSLDPADLSPEIETPETTGATSSRPTPTTASPTTRSPSATSGSGGSNSARPTARPSSRPSSSTTGGGGPGDPTSAQAVLDQINRARAQQGLRPLVMNAGLVASAEKHNLRMSGGCGLQHQCPGEASVGSRINAEGVSWGSFGENIGYGRASSASTSAVTAVAMGLTTDMLHETPPNDWHRRNILSPGFDKVGISVYRDSSGTVWMTQDFAG
jgi:uncharacterized protein YkwD